MKQEIGYLCIQCKAPDGKVGTFISSSVSMPWIPVSPVFNSLADLFPWLKTNGWKEHNSRAYIKMSE